MAFKFEGLLIWQKAIELSGIVNEVCAKFPKEELYILSSQIKRAADSVALNIAEGSQGQSNPEFKRFIGYSIRSNIEVVSCIFIAKRRKIISEEDFDLIYKESESLIKMLQAFRKNIN